MIIIHEATLCVCVCDVFVVCRVCLDGIKNQGKYQQKRIQKRQELTRKRDGQRGDSVKRELDALDNNKAPCLFHL